MIERGQVKHDSQNIYYRSTIGAAEAGSTLELGITLKTKEDIRQVLLRVWREGQGEKLYPLATSDDMDAEEKFYKGRIQLPETENIAEGKPVQASAHNDVYVSSNLNDGKTTTYWESKGFPAEMTVDLQGTFTVSTAAFLLNPASIWEPRTQEIAVLVSTDGENFTEVSPAAAYTFDAETGNRVRIDFEAVQASHVRVIITSNTAAPAHAKGAQVAEICIYGE